MPDYRPIITALETADGGSRELDAKIFDITAPKLDPGRIAFKVRDYSKEPGKRLSRWHDGWLHGKHEFDKYAEDLPRFSMSLDAAIALVERLLPGWHYTMASTHTLGDAQPWADLASPEWIRDENDTEHAEAQTSTLPLALLLALFRALNTKETGDG